MHIFKTPLYKLILFKDYNHITLSQVTSALQDYVGKYMGERFIEPQTQDLSLVYKDSSPTTPLIFVLSMGTDPAADLYKFAEEMRFSKKLSAISLGQGQVRS